MKTSELLNSNDESVILLGLRLLQQSDFLEYLLENNYSNYFKYVCARILNDLNSIHFHNSLKPTNKIDAIIIQESAGVWHKSGLFMSQLIHFCQKYENQ